MRFSSSFLLALPALAVAEQQVPLADKVKGWLNMAQSYVSSAVPSVPSPAVADAAKVAETVVTPLTLSNWKSVLSPSASSWNSEPDEWMVFVTGGNKTCYGVCGNVTEAWNKSAALLSAKPGAPHLAILDCETEPILCNCWASGAPAIYHILVPKPLADQSKPATTVRYIRLNTTTTTASDITEIHAKQTYKDVEPYEGAFHPFDGLLARFQLAVPFAYVMWGMAKMPSWLPMIAVSFISRSFMNRRMNQPNRQGGAAPAAPAAAR